jgi:hypothetical protein
MSHHASRWSDGAVSSWWSPNHRPRKLSAEPPVTSAQSLWRLVKDGHVATKRGISSMIVHGFYSSRAGDRPRPGDYAEMKDEPRTSRRGWLKNDNPPGDFTKAAQCGAKTRRETACKGPAMRNGRCRMHGGLSTGPRTPEGLARSRKARWIHGLYSRETRLLRTESLLLLQGIKALLG